MPTEPMPADPWRTPHDWLDHDAGPVVRAYAMTQGRVAPEGGGFDLLAFVVSLKPGRSPAIPLQPEHHAIVNAAWEPITVVELAAKLDLSTAVIRVLLGDLHAGGRISLYRPPPASLSTDLSILKAVVHGLRKL